jgi:hypothetical protein
MKTELALQKRPAVKREAEEDWGNNGCRKFWGMH